jgi:hypothetical protein
MDNPKPRPQHLVYVGINDGKTELYIQLDQEEPAVASHNCPIYYPDNAGQVVSARNGTSADVKVEELGWFSDPVAFDAICRGVPVPQNLATQEEAFNDWKSTLLDVLQQNHAQRWTRNTGNHL